MHNPAFPHCMFRLINIMTGKINNQKFPAPRALSRFRVHHPSLAPRRTDQIRLPVPHRPADAAGTRPESGGVVCKAPGNMVVFTL